MSFRKITIKSGNEESTLEVTKEEYQRYYCPWWQQKKHEQRNREAMEQNGYTEESYEAWRDNASEGAGIPDMELPGGGRAGGEKAAARRACGCDGFPPARREGACHEGVRGGNAGQRVCERAWSAPDNRVLKEDGGAGETPRIFPGKRVGCLIYFTFRQKRILLSNGSEKSSHFTSSLFPKVSLRKVGG